LLTQRLRVTLPGMYEIGRLKMNRLHVERCTRRSEQRELSIARRVIYQRLWELWRGAGHPGFEPIGSDATETRNISAFHIVRSFTAEAVAALRELGVDPSELEQRDIAMGETADVTRESLRHELEQRLAITERLLNEREA
jgi:hypothetical protein